MEAIFGISAKFPSYLVGLFEHVKNCFFDEPRRRYVRGECGWMMGYGGCSEGCIHTAPSVVRYDHDFGEPKDKLCAETSHGIFERALTKTHVIMDCNSFVANITLANGARLV